jgi:hypothetical protein
VEALQLTECACCPAALSHLGRLLAARTLRELALCAGDDGEDSDVHDPHALFAVAPPGFAEGLRASALTRLTLNHTRLFATAAGGEVLRALVGHPTLRVLVLPGNPAATEAAAAATGEALAALLAADTLTELDVGGAKLRAAGCAPLLAALAATTQLQKLDIACQALQPRFVVEQLAPAARASGVLELRLQCECDECAGVLQAAVELEVELQQRARARGHFPYSLPEDLAGEASGEDAGDAADEAGEEAEDDEAAREEEEA